jgi:hypothetical protein
MSNDTRKFIASGFLVVVLIALVAYLTFIPVPTANKDLVVTILGVLVGAGAAAIPNLVGDAKAETKQLQDEIASLRSELDIVRTQYSEVKVAYDQIVAMLIKRHVVDADGIEVSQERNDA